MMKYFLLLITCLIVFKFALISAEISYMSAFFIFGDSSVDPGNNNHIKTIPENQANYKPYGHNSFFKDPTGRFSNGRIIVDFLGISIVPLPFFTLKKS